MIQNKRLLIRRIKFTPCVGIGYWADIYDGRFGIIGVVDNYLIPFFVIRRGWIESIK